jgi:hypothetical protein
MEHKEVWQTIPWSNGLYLASNFGNIKRVEGVVKNQSSSKINIGHRKVGGKKLSPKTKKNGYKEVNLHISPQVSKMCYVHRAVYFSFNPNADYSLEINHINCDKSDNSLSNLELVTASENMRHAYTNNLNKISVRYGESSGCSKLKEHEVLEIRKIYAETRAVNKIAKMFGIGNTHVQRIVKRQSWAHI